MHAKARAAMIVLGIVLLTQRGAGQAPTVTPTNCVLPQVTSVTPSTGDPAVRKI